jgi:hypothetical protein
MVFDSASDGERTDMGSIEEYFTQGARAGFTWYWQRGGYWESVEFTRALFEASIPRDTPPDRIAVALVALGLTEAEARSMIDWLGQDVVILLPAPPS